MKEHQPRTIYKDAQSVDEPDAQHLFEQAKHYSEQETFVLTASEPAQPPVLDEFEGIIRPKKRRRWPAMLAAGSFVGLAGWQLIDNLATAIGAGDWLSLGWAGFVSVLGSFGLAALTKEWLKLRRLRGHFSVQEQTEQLIKGDSVGKGAEFCQKLAQKSGLREEYQPYERWRNAVKAHHSDAEIIEMYDAMVVTQLDRRAVEVITKHATESAGLVAISPLATADMLLVVWRNLKMIDALSKVYGIELGYWSRIRLLRLVFVNMAAAGASELAIDASMDMMSMDLAGKLSVRAGQGLGIGILTARLGLKSIELLRPTPWQEGRRVTLGSIRKQIISKVAALTVK
ncbi:YcjF family protein [Vibrio sp. WXL210]|uniref:YcjF family protein n=1 Tax=Vibrio sp. WXL210 TaxID=3450709 RepID=UPI003EC7EC3E